MIFQDEMICDFLVTSERKHLNAVFLDMLQEFDRLCKKADITYWVIFGACLGAVRHKGFIPWDDDVDIAVPRKDFDRLMSMTNEEFGAKEPYFLQNFITDPACIQSLIRFRRSDTTSIRDYDLAELQHTKSVPYNMGLNLAIFPLDVLPKSPLVQKVQYFVSSILHVMRHRAYQPANVRPLRHFICHSLARLIGDQNFAQLRHWPYRWCKNDRHELLQVMNGFYDECTCYPSSVFHGTSWLPFEDIEIPVPGDYDQYLSITYGDYMEFPPVEKRQQNHGAYERWDVPYTVSCEAILRGELELPH